jgi:hypothetical protein
VKAVETAKKEGITFEEAADKIMHRGSETKREPDSKKLYI